MSRKRQQADLLFALGQFLGPVLRVAANPTGFDEDEQTRLLARFFHDARGFNGLLSEFCLKGEPGHRYEIQFQEVQAWLGLILATRRPKQEIFDVVRSVHENVLEALLSIPIPLDSAIHEAHTPFSTYCFVKDLCSTIRASLVWLDRYFDQTVFHRFLFDVPAGTQITLVTLPTSSARNKIDQKRIDNFMDVSRSFAVERGSAGYRLLASDVFHDRWLRCDDSLFTLGGSIKDLTKPFTISKLDSTVDNKRHFDDVISAATEVFGPATSSHP